MPKGTTVDRNIFKRGEFYYVRYTDSKGKQRVRSTRSGDIKHARALLAKEMAASFEGREFPDKATALRMDRLGELWLKHVAPRASLTNYRQRFKRIVSHFGAERRVDTLRHEDVDDLRDWLMTLPGRKKKPMQHATIVLHLATLRAATYWAVRAGHLHRSPMVGYKIHGPDNERDRVVTPEELEKILAACDPEVRLATIIAHETAMRLGEIAALDWSQVKLNRRIIHLRAGTTKSGEGRKVPLTPRVIQELRPLEQPSGKLFTMRAKYISKAYMFTVEKLEFMDPPRFHDLRHTAATNLRRAGVDLFTLQAITGHKTLEMLRRYQKVDDDDLLEAVGKLGSRR